MCFPLTRSSGASAQGENKGRLVRRVATLVRHSSPTCGDGEALSQAPQVSREAQMVVQRR